MKNNIRILQLVALLTLTPVYLAANQNVPTLSTYQSIMLLCTIGAFGMIMAQFWLTRSKLLGLSKIPTATVIKYHKIIGIVAGGFLLLHPILMVARRYWVQESDPFSNLMLLIQTPTLRSAVFAWIALALLLLLSGSRIHRKLRFQEWKHLHGALSLTFIAFSLLHITSVGRHSNTTMTAFWILLCGTSVMPLISSWIPKIYFRHKIHPAKVSHK